MSNKPCDGSEVPDLLDAGAIIHACRLDEHGGYEAVRRLVDIARNIQDTKLLEAIAQLPPDLQADVAGFAEELVETAAMAESNGGEVAWGFGSWVRGGRYVRGRWH